MFEATWGELLLWFVVLPLTALAAGFLIGSVNPATIIARLLGKDLSGGSGNPGATNAGRVLGVRWGVIVAVVDILKGLVPVLVFQHALGLSWGGLVGVGLVFGHVWSPWLRGRGGKGVATALGVALALSPWLALVLVVVFAVVYWRTHWVASGSIAASMVLIVVGVIPMMVFLPGDVLDSMTSSVVSAPFFEYSGAWLVIGLVVLYRHRGNVNGYLAARRMRKQGADGSTPET